MFFQKTKNYHRYILSFLQGKRTNLIIGFCSLFLTVSVFAASQIIQSDKVILAGTVPNEKFGQHVAISRDESTLAAVSTEGVYIFGAEGNAWDEETLITANELSGDIQYLKAALSSDGNRLIVGAKLVEENAEYGVAYVFVRTLGLFWTQEAKILPVDSANEDYFAHALDMSDDGTTLILGAFGADIGANQDAGAAYIFTRSGSIWSEQAKLTASDRATHDQFGISVALSADGGNALIGSHTADVSGKENAGAAYVFTRSGSSWSQQAKLVASDAVANGALGFSVDLSSDASTAIMGTYGVSAYVFTRSGLVWSQQAKLNPQNSSIKVFPSVSFIGQSRVLIGYSGTNSMAYLFSGSLDRWNLEETFTAANSGAFGWAVAANGNVFSVGAYNDVNGKGNISIMRRNWCSFDESTFNNCIL